MEFCEATCCAQVFLLESSALQSDFDHALSHCHHLIRSVFRHPIRDAVSPSARRQRALNSPFECAQPERFRRWAFGQSILEGLGEKGPRLSVEHLFVWDRS
jgi:hypothetical protein